MKANQRDEAAENDEAGSYEEGRSNAAVFACQWASSQRPDRQTYSVVVTLRGH